MQMSSESGPARRYCGRTAAACQRVSVISLHTHVTICSSPVLVSHLYISDNAPSTTRTFSATSLHLPVRLALLRQSVSHPLVNRFFPSASLANPFSHPRSTFIVSPLSPVKVRARTREDALSLRALLEPQLRKETDTASRAALGRPYSRCSPLQRGECRTPALCRSPPAGNRGPSTCRESPDATRHDLLRCARSRLVH